MVAYISAVRSTRAVLEAKDKAARAGVIDDVGFLDAETDIHQALSEQQLARKAYSRHRQERHEGSVGEQ